MSAYKPKPEETATLLKKELRRRGMSEAEIQSALRKKKRSRVLTFNAVKKSHLMDMRAATKRKPTKRALESTPRKQPSRSSNELCTVHFAAEQLSLHRKTVLRFIREGRLPATRVGKSYRIKRSDLEAFSGLPAAPTQATAQPSMTSIVDIPSVSAERAVVWKEHLTATVNSRRQAGNLVRAEVVYEPESAHLKVIVIGPPNECVGLLGLIRVWMDQL